ncbi:MAG: hypothetical protein R3F21_09550 [Myxococcota bacterium]
MRRIEVIRPEPARDGWKGGSTRARRGGPARSVAASPPACSLWMDVVELDPGGYIALDSGQGDEALYVVQGELAVDGQICPAGGAVVIEEAAAARFEALRATRLLHMGPRPGDGDPTAGPAPKRGQRVHVLGPRGLFEACESGRETHFFADSTCPTCSLWLLRTGRDGAYASPVHSHSQDELIHVLTGEIRIGSLVVRPGETLFVAADQPYRFHGSAGGFAFVNYRSGPSRMTMRATGETIVENGTATGMHRVMDAVPAA